MDFSPCGSDWGLSSIFLIQQVENIINHLGVHVGYFGVNNFVSQWYPSKILIQHRDYHAVPFSDSYIPGTVSKKRPRVFLIFQETRVHENRTKNIQSKKT